MTQLKPLPSNQWSEAAARHLLNRAGFGVPREMVAELFALGLDSAVDRLVQFTPRPEDALRPGFILDPISRREIAMQAPEMREAMIRELVQERQREERAAMVALKAWWLERMLTSPRPLEEKLALFWHGHFATSAQKVKESAHIFHMNDLFRRLGAGNVKALTVAVGQSPAMLRYLDNQKNVKDSPNENWARELMELFTLGKGHYSEGDIKESARAFTGWAHDGSEFVYRMQEHDFGPKSFLGRDGALDGWDVIDIIFEQPACAEFLAAKLWRFFAHDEPDPELVRDLAHVFRSNGYEMRPLLAAMFRSAAFYGDRARATQVKSPAQLAVQLCEDLELPNPPYTEMARALRGLGQDLFYPPNVKGWDGNRAWINANTLLLRYNLPAQLVQASTARSRARDTAMMSMSAADGQDPEARMMAEAPAPVRPEAPTPEARAAYREQVKQQVRERLAGASPEVRLATMQRIRQGTPQERRAALRELGIALPPWERHASPQLFEELRFETAGGCVDALAVRMLVTPLRNDQKESLLRVLGAKTADDPMRPENVPNESRRAVVHLITSMAEYQLC